MKRFIKLAIVQYDVVIFDGTDEMANELNLKQDKKGWYAYKKSIWVKKAINII